MGPWAPPHYTPLWAEPSPLGCGCARSPCGCGERACCWVGARGTVAEPRARVRCATHMLVDATVSADPDSGNADADAAPGCRVCDRGRSAAARKRFGSGAVAGRRHGRNVRTRGETPPATTRREQEGRDLRTVTLEWSGAPCPLTLVVYLPMAGDPAGLAQGSITRRGRRKRDQPRADSTSTTASHLLHCMLTP